MAFAAGERDAGRPYAGTIIIQQRHFVDPASDSWLNGTKHGHDCRFHPSSYTSNA
jgi:hypothetical protein